jgi:branched-chain amino acid transport system ATP-binding protein
LVLDVCDYLYVLNFGEILAEGTPDQIGSRPDVVAAYFGEAVEEAAPRPRGRSRTGAR